MEHYSIYPGKVYVDLDSFPSRSPGVVATLHKVADIFHTAMGSSPGQFRQCLVRRRAVNDPDDCPECRDFCGSDIHEILLVSDHHHLCQVAYQFAHEYCHHLTGGKRNGRGTGGLMWLEECLCETGSQYALTLLTEDRRFFGMCRSLPILSPTEYLRSHVGRDLPLHRESLQSGFLRRHPPETREGRYPRHVYRVAARRLLPFFLQEPSLWRLLQHLGDSTSWQSPEALLAHLWKAMRPLGVDTGPMAAELLRLL